MSSYVSAIFEKSRLINFDEVRLIVRARDDGQVPPTPSAIYYPTHPDDLNYFLVMQYVNNTIGEIYLRVATLSDLSTYDAKTLNTLYDPNVDFVSAGVAPGDLVNVTITDDTLWTSAEYPSGNPFVFQVKTVVDATHLQVTLPFPAFYYQFNWQIERVSLASSTGVTRREDALIAGSIFRDRRINRLFSTVIELENAVTSMKADIQALVNANTGNSLSDETTTVGSTL